MSQETQEPKRNSQDCYTERQFQKKFFGMGACCYYCGTPLLLRETHREHRTPKCRGGSDHISNIVPACAPCNQMKGWRTEAEFIKARPALYAQGAQGRRGIDKPNYVPALEVQINEPTLLKKIVSERETVSWAWKNPA